MSRFFFRRVPSNASLALLPVFLGLAFSFAGCAGSAHVGSTSASPATMTASIAPAQVTLSPGESAVFTAQFNGTTPANITWTATGGTIAGSGPSGSFVAGSAPGTYQVSASAPGSASVEATATVVIAAPPTPAPSPAPAPAPSSPTTSSPAPAPAPAPTPAPTSTSTSTTSRLFPSSSADWLYSAPNGSGIDISSITSALTFQVNDHTQGFDYPVVDTDGTHGCTTFTDTAVYSYQTDRICVPNPPNGYYPSVGGWGADDGHLVVVDTATGEYYDFWKLYATNGVPDSTNVGGIVQGSLSGNGTPGTTAANITGLAGDIMPGELDCATCLNHALSVGVPGGMNSTQVGTQAPATKTDGSVPGAVFREGAKIRVDPSLDVSKLGVSVAVQAIMRALQLYGGVITDQGGNGSTVMFYSDLSTPPNVTGIDQIGRYLQIYY